MAGRLRVLTFNVLTSASADGPARFAAIRRALPALGADVVALQELSRAEAEELLGPGWEVLPLPGGAPGEVLASRLPLGAVSALDEPVAGGSFRAHALAAEVLAPPPLGTVLVIHHKGTFERDREDVRERQALATAHFAAALAGTRPVVLLGDFNAGADAASIRFLTGRQSLDGFSVCYEDAWEAVHGDVPGHTFSPRNPLVPAGEMPLERGRRIDRVLVRSGAHGPPLDVADCHLAFDAPVDGIWPSDHFGVLAELRPAPHPPGEWASDQRSSSSSASQRAAISPSS